jgi:hypothetical protein
MTMEIKTATRRVANPDIMRRGGTRQVDLAVTDFDHMDMQSSYAKVSDPFSPMGDDAYKGVTRTTYEPTKGKSINDAPMRSPRHYGAGEVTVTTMKSDKDDDYAVTDCSHD